MPKSTPALKTKNLIRKLQDDLESAPRYLDGTISKGIAGSKGVEPIPRFAVAPSELVVANGTNAYIVVGKDRPGSVLSGFGGRGDSGAGTLDMVAGRMSHNPAQVNDNGEYIQANPDFKIDASRIYVSQKTNIDENFDLVRGKVGNSRARAGIGIKSDAVRVIGREGIKLVTGTDIKNSTGEKVVSVSGIDLIAGNEDSNLQPLVLGNNVNESLIKLTNFVNDLAGIVHSAILYQIKYNTEIQSHTHISPFFGIPTAPSDQLIPAGTEVVKKHTTKTNLSIVKFRTNLKFHIQTYYSVSGKKYINSSFNNTN